MDKSKVGEQWSLCSRCKNNNSDKCCDCTMLVGFQDIVICNISVGLSMQYYHQYFEEDKQLMVMKECAKNRP